MVDIEVFPIGGYSDFGRNMSAVRVGREIVIFDMGIRLDRVLLHEDAVFDEMHPLDLQRLGAIPDDTILKNVSGRVVAIVIGHGHLDHVGAVGKLAAKYKAPIIATPYTIKLIEDMTRVGPPSRGNQRKGQGSASSGRKTQQKAQRSIPNKLITMKAGESRSIGRNGLELEFVHTTHSIPHTVFPVLHTPRGALVYANDYKFDNTPVVGPAPDYKRLQQLANEGVVGLIVESTNAGKETKTESEMIARDMLRDFLFGVENDRNALIISTFSSHVARMKSIIDFGTELDREVVLLGRSMEKYSTLAQDVGLLDLPKNVRTYGYGRAVESALKKISRDPTKYLVVATGHQGEPGSLLTRLANRELPFEIEKNDQFIFSANVIPTPVNRANRYVLETKLKMQGARIIKGAHVSGHACRVDHQELLRMLEPQHIFPAHGGIDLQSEFVELAEGEGYRLNETVHVLRNHQSYEIP